MADVVDTMFGWLVDILGWVFDKFLKLCGWLIKLIVAGFVSLFRLIFKKNDSGRNTATDSIDRAPANQIDHDGEKDSSAQ